MDRHAVRVCDLEEALSPRLGFDGCSDRHTFLLQARVLVIDVLDDDTLLGNFGAIDVSSLLAVVVSNDEIAAHEALLDTIAREAKLTPVWRLELYSPTVLGEVQ